MCGLAIGTGTDIASKPPTIIASCQAASVGCPTPSGCQGDDSKHSTKPFWAFAYNVAQSVAAGVLYPFNDTLLSPITAARAMAMSSLFVLVNALRLEKRFNFVAAHRPACRENAGDLVFALNTQPALAE